MAAAVLYTWMYNSTGSILLVIIFHGMHNTFPIFAVFPSFDLATLEIPEVPILLVIADIIVCLVLAAVIVIFFGSKRLAKEAKISNISFQRESNR